MAIATPVDRKVELSVADVQVRSPLHKLRGSIRKYVIFEGLILVAIYLALWFWIGLLLDYGFFKLFTIDWVQELPVWFRGAVLAALITGMIALLTFKIALRLSRDFRDAALALVLERRFPGILGDRLITAVELSNSEEAARLGFSRVMLHQTVQEAAVKVEQVPINEVFDWNRLKRSAMTVVLLTVGLFFLVGLAFYVQFKNGKLSANGGGFGTLTEVSTLWVERNLFLQNIIWPRQAHLTVLYPHRDLTIGRNQGDPGIRVRAYKWVVADANAPEGWRGMRWADQQKFLGSAVADGVLPADWKPRDPEEGLTIDEIELRLDDPDTHKGLSSEAKNQLRDFLDRLENKTKEPGMRRKLRMLEVPESVVVTYRGPSSRNEMTLVRQGDNEFGGQFSGLKETVRYWARGKDYVTPIQSIRVVPPPSLDEMTADEDRPAYLYYRLRHNQKELKGQKQIERGHGISVQGGDQSTLQVPFGTDVTLNARADKELASAPVIHIDSHEFTGQVLHPVEGDPHRFQVQVLFKDQAQFLVRGSLKMTIDFTDTDGVSSQRRLEIVYVPDKPPEVIDLQVDAIRRGPQGFMVTPIALIPFVGTIRDDIGLDKVEFAYTVSKVDRQAEQAEKALRLLGAVLMPPGLGQECITAMAISSATKLSKDKATEAAEADIKRLTMTGFTKEMETRDQRKFFEMNEVLEALKDKPLNTTGLYRDFALKADDPDSARGNECGFDLKKVANDFKTATSDFQVRFRMQLWIEAIDNDIETGPHHSQVKERLPFVVVSEEELLSEIGKEEEALSEKAQEVVDKLQEKLTKTETAKEALDTVKKSTVKEKQADIILGLSGRAEELEKVVDSNRGLIGEVREDYKRILKEERTNRIRDDMIKTVEEINKDLEAAFDVDFQVAKKALETLHEKLEPKKNSEFDFTQAEKAYDDAHQKSEELISRLKSALSRMGKLIEINKLITMLVNMQKDEEAQIEKVKTLEKEIRNRVLD